jgi:hypothetical protein
MEKESKRKTRKNYPLKSKHQPQEWKGEGRITMCSMQLKL